MEVDRRVINCAPMCKGKKYEMWKMRIIVFFEYSGIEFIDIIQHGIPTLFDAFESMNDEKKYMFLLNVKARHILMCALSEEEMSKV